MTDNPQNARCSFEEFKLYYESAEKVTDRRLETNRWNYSICAAMVIAIATITNWSLSNPALTWGGLSLDVLLSAMAILFCILWIRQIRDFKNLNNAKFAVLNEMAPIVDFNFEKPGSVTSFCPFDKEWKKLTELRALREVGRSKMIALGSSNIEYFIPRAFTALFTTILFTLLLVVVTHWPPSSLAQRPNSTGANAPQGHAP